MQIRDSLESRVSLCENAAISRIRAGHLALFALLISRRFHVVDERCMSIHVV